MKLYVLFKNKVMIYLVTRYITYFIQFVTSLVIADVLGPYYFGIWGFVLLQLQYFQQFHFGIANSFNVLYVQNLNDQRECNNFIANSLVLNMYLGVIVGCFFFYYSCFGIDIFEKYQAEKYILWICIIAILQYFVQFFINLFRVKNQLNRVAFCQSVVVALTFFVIFLFKGENLIVALVASYLIGYLMCFVLAITSGSIPSLKNVTISFSYQKRILTKGLFLFLYNSCFYFIIITIRSIISSNYSVEEFGLFTFSFTLAQAILLILEAISFIIFPKVINKLSSKAGEVAINTIKTLRFAYMTLAHVLMYIAMLFFPLFIYLMPKYSKALTALNLISLTVLIGCCSYSYIELLISRNKEKLMSLLSASALIINVVLGILFVVVLKVRFHYAIIATMITYYLYTFAVVASGMHILGEYSFRKVIIELMPFRLLLPFVMALIIAIFEWEELIWAPLLVFIITNWTVKGILFDLVKKLLQKPDVVNL